MPFHLLEIVHALFHCHYYRSPPVHLYSKKREISLPLRWLSRSNIAIFAPNGNNPSLIVADGSVPSKFSFFEIHRSKKESKFREPYSTIIFFGFWLMLSEATNEICEIKVVVVVCEQVLKGNLEKDVRMCVIYKFKSRCTQTDRPNKQKAQQELVKLQ